MEATPFDPSDVHALLRLLATSQPALGDLATAKRALLAGLAGLVGADAWVWALEEHDLPASPLMYLELIEDGWSSEAQRLLWMESLLSREFGLFSDRLPKHPIVAWTRVRSDLIPDGEWHSSPYYVKYRAPAGLDDLLVSRRATGRQTVTSSVRMHRFQGRPPFGARERALVDAVSRAVDWLHQDSASRAALDLERFPCRLREVFFALLSGDSKKEVARRLHLSEYTVNDYIKELYDRLHVHSRGQFFACVLGLDHWSGGSVLKCRLSSLCGREEGPHGLGRQQGVAARERGQHAATEAQGPVLSEAARGTQPRSPTKSSKDPAMRGGQAADRRTQSPT